jgi:hypothetical protein
VIGWAIGEHLYTELVDSAAATAVAVHGELADQVIVRADRGCQYTFQAAGAVRPQAQSGVVCRAPGVLG